MLLLPSLVDSPQDGEYGQNDEDDRLAPPLQNVRD